MTCGTNSCWRRWAGLTNSSTTCRSTATGGRGGPAVDFTDADYYTMLGEAHATESFVERTAELIRAAVPPGKNIGVALDEWGVWHPEARLQPEGCDGCPRHAFEQRSTLRDALAAGVALEGFVRQCNVLSMANLAQVVNVLQAVVVTDGAAMFRTPTYYAVQLHAPHMGATALALEIAAGDALPDGSPGVSGIASRGATGTAITLTNRHRHAAADVCIELGADGARAVRAGVGSGHSGGDEQYRPARPRRAAAARRRG